MLRLECTDAISFLRSLDSNSVDCMVHSPPYLAQRRYSADGYLWESITYTPMSGLPAITIPEWRGELGLEPTVDLYVGHLMTIYREAKRVLKPSGSFWLNIGDKHEEKSLTLIPQRFALALEADGWYLRADCIWHKPNGLPGSQVDRFTINHEYVFHCTKSLRYWFDMQAVAEPIAESTGPRMDRGISAVHKNVDGAPGQSKHSMMQPRENAKLSGGDFSKEYTAAQPEHGGDSHRKPYLTRSKRTVMTVPTVGSAYDFCRCGRLYLGSERAQIREERINPETGKLQEYMKPCLECGRDDQYVSHYAAYNRALIEPLIEATCSPMVCSVCGTPYKRIVKKVGSNWQERKEAGASVRYGINNNKGQGPTHYGGSQYVTDSHANDGTHNKEPYRGNNPHRMRLTIDRPQRRRAEELFQEHGLTQAHLDAIVAVGLADTGKALHTMSGAGKNAEETQRLADEAKAALGGYYREFCYNHRRETLGWQKMCSCETDETEPGIVCDMFSGSGTTAMTAISLGRRFVGCEINPDYVALSNARIARWREDPQFKTEHSTISPENAPSALNEVPLGSSKPVQMALFGDNDAL